MRKLSEIEADVAAATQGPWTRESGSYAYVMIDSVPLLFEPRDGPVGEADADFVSHARTDVPDLCAALREAMDLLGEAVPAAAIGRARWKWDARLDALRERLGL